jgi:hypothetical protein
MLYGIHVLSASGEEITAMNNRMIDVPDIANAKAGDKLTFSWDMLNVFNDGKYTLSLTLADSSNNTLDWHSEAAKFTVKRIERSTTYVLPPLQVKSEVVKK